MNKKQTAPAPAAAAITLRDIYYILFRHKWMIISFATLGVIGCMVVSVTMPVPYTSEAAILLRYVQDAAEPGLDAQSRRIDLDTYAAEILNTEQKILVSRDLAIEVATNIGPEKILGKSGASNEVGAAATLIVANLKAEVPRDCNVIPLHFTGKSSEEAQQVLQALIAAYKNKYVEIHLSAGVTEDYLNKQKDAAKGELAVARTTLRDAKAKMNVIDLEETKKAFAVRITRQTDEILQAKQDLAVALSNVKDLQERLDHMPGVTAAAPGTNLATNLASTVATNLATNATLPAAPEAPAPEVVSKYQSLVSILNSRRAQEQELELHFTTNAPRVTAALAQCAAAEEDIKKFEEQNPSVKPLKASAAGGLGQTVPALTPAVDPRSQLLTQWLDAMGKERALEAKFKELTNQLASVETAAKELGNQEQGILDAQSQTASLERIYTNLVFSAEQMSANEVSGSKVSNIFVSETPTPGLPDRKSVTKMAEMILGGFLALAFGLPFFIEMILDQSLKHPADVQARIAAPYFVTIPKTNGPRKQQTVKTPQPASLLPAIRTAHGPAPAPGTEETVIPLQTDGKLEPWDERHELRPFFETLRDRLMTYFEMINLTHKPKLVAVTSCGAGAGVTTTAAGLASSLSETGEGNVLLVSMNVADGEVHHFYKGKAACGIEEVLEKEHREAAHVQNKLFLAEEKDSQNGLPRVLPKRFSHLVPMLKASDFDYIIFDMPPVSEISITPRLARFMDMVLLVIESGKTSRDAAVRVASLLAESKTNVGLVLNKNRSYLPKRLEERI